MVGNTFDKRVIFRAINVLDVDGDKQVSFQELHLFIYRVWRSQIDDIVEQLRIAATEHLMYGSSSRQLTISGSKVAKLVKDRDALKEALKRNYPRYNTTSTSSSTTATTTTTTTTIFSQP